ncbi:hypothetical protein, partial [Citrobacter werkmanii]|uniref:hypothetical protein n=1 Tax=Citrobacter werkmanii TaxID=67827 RepID=UPI001A918089
PVRGAKFKKPAWETKRAFLLLFGCQAQLPGELLFELSYTVLFFHTEYRRLARQLIAPRNPSLWENH